MQDNFKNSIVEGDTEVCLQDLPNITDHRTFGEIENDEQAQWNYIHGKLLDHRFDSEQAAKYFVGECMVHTFKRLGADMSIFKEKLSREEFEKQLYAKFRIRISQHRKSQHNEYWEAGNYIYKDKELVAFIGKANKVESEFVLSIPFWLVRTNVQLPGGKGVMH